MEQLNGANLEIFPYPELSKVYDLIEFDGPLLSHYKDASDLNFLFYWVDSDSEVNRWMLIEISNDEIKDYLNSEISLKFIIRSKSNVIITHIKRDMSYSESIYVLQSQIPINYYPEEDSFYTFDIPAQYFSDPISENQYLNILRDGASVFRLRPKNPYFNHAVRAVDAGKFLINLTSSASVYSAFEFYNSFKDNITDPDKMKSTILNVKKSTELLVVNTQFSSFEVTLAIDTIVGMEDNLKGYEEWRKSIFRNYFEDVIDVDYSIPESIVTFKEKFPDEAVRKKIIKPIADILLDSSFAFETKSSAHDAPVLHKSINKTTYKRLIAPTLDSATPDQQNDRKKLMNFVVEVIERDGKTIFGKKSLDEGILFQNEIQNVSLSLNFFTFEKYEISFKKPLIYYYSIDSDNLNNIDCSTFNLTISGKSKNYVIKKFWNSLGNFIIDSIENDNNKDLLNEYIEEVSELN